MLSTHYDNGSELNLHFKAQYGITCKTTSVKNPSVNAILMWVHQEIPLMLRTTELHMATTGANRAKTASLTHATWAIPCLPRCSTVWLEHVVWHYLPCCLDHIGDHRQHHINLLTTDTSSWLDGNVFSWWSSTSSKKDGNLHKTTHSYTSDPWTIS